MQLMELKIATARALICISEADRPLSLPEITAAIAVRYEKEHDAPTMANSIRCLIDDGLIDNEFQLTNLGTDTFLSLVMNSHGWAEKFFRKSNSPNVGPRAARNTAKPSSAFCHAFNVHLSVVR